MKLGFVGTGTISAAIINGLGAAGWDQPIVVSPRNATLADELAAKWAFVSVAASNQDVVDRSDTVVLGIRPQIAESVLGELVFGNVRDVVSLVATFSVERLRGLIGQGPGISRAIPLPFVEDRVGATPVFPAQSAAAEIFDRVGGALRVDDEAQLDLIMTASSTMGIFFQQQAAIADWLEDKGIAPELARSYLGQLVNGLALSADRRGSVSFADLAHEFSTPGGLNEQLRHHLADAGMPSRSAKGSTVF